MSDYPDHFLEALGRWQNGWSEDKAKRLEVTNQLLTAISKLSKPLPITPNIVAYRKRFLVPNNPQNGGDFVALVVNGSISEGVASWTFAEGFAQEFKGIVRANTTTAIFEHRPDESNVVLDVRALWSDQVFRDAVSDYAQRGRLYAPALVSISDKQFEIILNVDLSALEVIDFVGRVADQDSLFEQLGAQSDEQKDIIWQRFVEINTFPGDLRWTGRSGAQRAIKRARDLYFWRRTRRIFKKHLLCHSFLVHPKAASEA